MAEFPPILFVLGFVYYVVQTRRGNATPHFGSWVVWTVISVSNAITCCLVMDDLRACLIPLIDALCVSLFLTSIWVSQRGTCRLSSFDLSLIAMALVGLGTSVWSPELSTMLMQIPFVLAVWPTIKGAFDGDEDPAVWSVWTVALLFNLGLTSGGFAQWVYPIVMFALHAAVLASASLAVLAAPKRRILVAIISAIKA